ncbi:thiol reductant ABC exporter subunit CydD [Uruburuella testudinis]|uniref:Thiol reductant ABC exporter subunit CydD n=1 Tax=Uruburuella testudinis TaxID=1282863 RepID=A0ABY4DPK6_9NEIS|nr:thiol reductant ABC exporter subunit CydD [Uruburuella testudinis]UOO80988.1 thiol reductant ABC exporter subunit CydD [Uruburuella testudinis]
MMRRAPRSAALLDALMRPYRRRLYLPLLAAWVALALLIWQSALLADLFAGWLNAAAAGERLPSDGLYTVLPWLLVCLLLRPLLSLYKERRLQNLSLDVRHQLRRRLLDALADLGPARSRFGSDGALSTRVLEQVDALDGYISRFYVQRTVAVATPLVIAAAVFAHSKLAALLLLLTAPLVPLFMILVGSAAAGKSREQLDTLAQLGGRFLDLVRGMPTLRRLNAATQAEKQVASAAEAYQRRTMGVLRLAFLSGAVLELFASLAIALVAVYLGLGLIGVLPWAQGEVPVPYRSALFILLLAPEFYAPLRQLGTDYHAKAQAQAAAEAVQPLLDMAAESSRPSENGIQTASERFHESIPETENTRKSTHQDALKVAPSLRLEQLAIGGEGDRERLAAVSFAVAAGARIGIGGRSGVGKSSLLQALLGFCAYRGRIWLNGEDCAGFDRACLQRQTAYLAQTATLLPGTVADNLRLANAAAGAEEMRQALEAVGLWDLIQRLPDGLNTYLGERGQGLSGGQQQRLSLAQLLLHDAPLWLLDEPAAHLDEETAADLYRVLGQISRGKTVLLVSHDLAAVPWLDEVVMLEGAPDER